MVVITWFGRIRAYQESSYLMHPVVAPERTSGTTDGSRSTVAHMVNSKRRRHQRALAIRRSELTLGRLNFISLNRPPHPPLLLSPSQNYLKSRPHLFPLLGFPKYNIPCCCHSLSFQNGKVRLFDIKLHISEVGPCPRIPPLPTLRAPPPGLLKPRRVISRKVSSSPRSLEHSS